MSTGLQCFEGVSEAGSASACMRARLVVTSSLMECSRSSPCTAPHRTSVSHPDTSPPVLRCAIPVMYYNTSMIPIFLNGGRVIVYSGHADTLMSIPVLDYLPKWGVQGSMTFGLMMAMPVIILRLLMYTLNISLSVALFNCICAYGLDGAYITAVVFSMVPISTPDVRTRMYNAWRSASGWLLVCMCAMVFISGIVI